MSTTPHITAVRYDHSIKDTVIDVAPYRHTTPSGDVFEVWTFYGNGGLITAEGFRIKRNGQTYARRQVVLVPTPDNVRKALGR